MAEGQEEIHLRDYWKIILKRRNSALTFFSVIVIVVTIGTLTTTPVYKATTRVLIDREYKNLAEIKDVYYDPYSEDYYQTQYELIKSTAVAYRVVKNLNLEQNPEFNPSLKKKEPGLFHSLFTGIRHIFKPDHKTESRESVDTALVLAKNIQGGLKVEPVKNSRIVNISYEHPDPRLAAAIADGIANAYVEQVLDIKMGTARQAVEWMTRKIEEQKKKLEESQQALQAYMKDKDIVELENKEAVTPLKLQNLSYQLIQAEAKRREAEALYNQVKGLGSNVADALTVPAIAGDPVIQSLRTEEIKIEKDIIEMSKKFGEKHPQMVRMKEDLKAVRDKIASEVKRAIQAIRNDYELAKAKEASLRHQFAQGKGEALALSEKAIQYGVLKREVESNQQMYEALLKRVKETSIIEEVRPFNISIIDRAEIPKSPVRPRRLLNIFLSIIVGIFGGIGISFFLEYLDNTFKTPDDVEERLSVPLLGVIPIIKGPDLQDRRIELISHLEQKSNVSEAYRALRTSILLSSVDPIKSIVITSPLENEGKTTTAVNLAISLAQMDKRVLLVDADLRKPKLHIVFGLDNSTGLSSFLTRQVIKEIIRESGIPNLSVITSGPIPPNSSELLSSKRMQEFVELVKEKFDMIIFDATPLIIVTDASILSTLVDGTVMVVMAGKTTFDVARRGVKLLRDINSRLLGSVLNGLDTMREGYEYLYPYYYSYGIEKKD
jgi:capsular exopolysaccharide synthesis family protein